MPFDLIVRDTAANIISGASFATARGNAAEQALWATIIQGPAWAVSGMVPDAGAQATQMVEVRLSGRFDTDAKSWRYDLLCQKVDIVNDQIVSGLSDNAVSR